MDARMTEKIESGMAFERARKSPPDGFPTLPDLPSKRYVDPDFLALEQSRVWRRSWLYAAHLDQLPRPGSYILWQKTGVPIIIVRGRDDVIRAFYNSCRHRGGPLVKEEVGELRGFTCGYHGWTYGLDGHLINLRDRRDFSDFDFSCRSLVSVRCERLGKWIFLSEDPEAEPLQDYLGAIGRDLAQFSPDELVLVDSKSFDVACNVKILLDAFLEVYHLQSIHKETVDRFLDHTATTITLLEKGHSRMVTPNRRADWIDPGTVGMPEIPTVTQIPRRNNVSYHIYPNIVMPAAATGMPMLLFWPNGPRDMRIECLWFSPPPGPEGLNPRWATRIANFERILAEDTQFAPQIQRSAEAGAFYGFPLNYQERRIYHWHEELDRRIGNALVPDALRVTPILEPYVESA